eukprot:Seg1592.2 transcript_id=Seg1592.2/GoldUCD/mRNA.D3Y31 product="Early growth response protein 1" protein_id=Seg1592.2/GoldUCD/D3Y31
MAEENKHNNYWLLTWEEHCSDDSSNASNRKNGAKPEESSDSSDGSSDSSELEEGSTFTESSEEEDDSSDSESGDENSQFPAGVVPGAVQVATDPSSIIGGDIVAEEIVGTMQGRQPFEEIIGEEVVGDTGENTGNDSELLIAIAGDSQPDRKQNANCVVQYMEGAGFDTETGRFGDVMDVNDVAGEEVVVRKKPAKKKKKAQSKNKEGGKPSKPKSSSGGSKSGKKSHECPICDKMFSSREAIRTHMKLHSDPDLFRCKICDKDFKFKQSLQRHMSHHTGEFPFYCRICGKGFVKGARCRDHERVHLKELDKGDSEKSDKPTDVRKSDRKGSKTAKALQLEHDDDDDDEIEDMEDDFATHPDENPWAQSDSEGSPPKKPEDLQIGAYEEIESVDSKGGKNADRKRKRKSKSPLKLKIKIG